MRTTKKTYKRDYWYKLLKQRLVQLGARVDDMQFVPESLDIDPRAVANGLVAADQHAHEVPVESREPPRAQGPGSFVLDEASVEALVRALGCEVKVATRLVACAR